MSERYYALCSKSYANQKFNFGRLELFCTIGLQPPNPTVGTASANARRGMSNASRRRRYSKERSALAKCPCGSVTGLVWSRRSFRAEWETRFQELLRQRNINTGAVAELQKLNPFLFVSVCVAWQVTTSLLEQEFRQSCFQLQPCSIQTQSNNRFHCQSPNSFRNECRLPWKAHF